MISEIQVLVGQIADVLVSAQSELLLFVAAFALHHFLFGNVFPRGKTSKKAGRKQSKAAAPPRLAGEESEGLEYVDDDDLAFAGGEVWQAQQAFNVGDHRAVLRLWNTMRRKSNAEKDGASSIPAPLLAQIVESMQRLKKDSRTILSEVYGYLKRHAELCHIEHINQFLDPLAKSLDAELVCGIVDLLPSLDIEADGTTYELLIQMFFATRSFDDVARLSKEMQRKDVAPTPRISLVLLKTALQRGRLEEALDRHRALASSGFSGSTSLCNARSHIALQLVELACREHRAELVLVDLDSGIMPVNAEILNALLAECAQARDAALTTRVERLCTRKGLPKTGRTYSLLIRGAGGDKARIQDLLKEMAANRLTEFTTDVAQAVLSVCIQHKDIELADQFCVLFRPDALGQVPALLSFIRFYAEAGESRKVCDLYENHLQRIDGFAAGERRRTLIDARTEKSVIAAALQCGRQDLASSLLEAAPADTAKHISMIRACAARGSLEEAMNTFRALQAGGAEMTNSLWNTALDACVEGGDLRRAGQLMQEMTSANVADVVSYNTLIKAYLRQDNYDRAWALVEDMRTAGSIPNHVTFNELIHALVRSRQEHRRSQVWAVVDEMKRCGTKPNRITCSILLKSLNAKSVHANVVRTLELTDAMDEPMDEVLLSSVVEACVRVGKPALLSQRLTKMHGSGITITGAHTFGSLIKAYGYAKDISGAWRCWKQMRSQHVTPTSITIGCMVEAVVSNGDVDGGYELVNTLLEDERCKDHVNAVVFGSVLKGYGRGRCMERVWTVFEEMLSRGISPSLATYNAIIDSCARNEQMDKVPGLLSDMKSRGLTPSLITFSTMMKGYCQRGDMSAAFAVLKELREGAASGCKPDEVVYNTLLDGCAQAGLASESERLLTEMQKDGIQPTNYSLTVMVRALGQARRVDRAFELVESITAKYRFRANSHVCAALIQACISSKDTGRAAATFERAARDRQQVDSRTCHNLLRAHLTAGLSAKAVSLLRAMLGLSGEAPVMLSGDRSNSGSGGTVDDYLLNDIFSALLHSSTDALLAPSLLADLRVARPRMRLNAEIERRVLAVA